MKSLLIRSVLTLITVNSQYASAMEPDILITSRNDNDFQPSPLKENIISFIDFKDITPEDQIKICQRSNVQNITLLYPPNFDIVEGFHLSDFLPKNLMVFKWSEGAGIRLSKILNSLPLTLEKLVIHNTFCYWRNPNELNFPKELKILHLLSPIGFTYDEIRNLMGIFPRGLKKLKATIEFADNIAQLKIVREELKTSHPDLKITFFRNNSMKIITTEDQ